MGTPAQDIRRVMLEVQSGLRSGSLGKVAAAQMLSAVTPPQPGKLPTGNGIKTFFHCSRCLEERPESQSPADWARLSVGFTREGMQVWCWRHGLNVAHIHFEGIMHQARTDAGAPDEDQRSQLGVTHDTNISALIAAVEYGYRCHEKGRNIQSAKSAFVDGEKP